LALLSPENDQVVPAASSANSYTILHQRRSKVMVLLGAKVLRCLHDARSVANANRIAFSLLDSPSWGKPA